MTQPQPPVPQPPVTDVAVGGGTALVITAAEAAFTVAVVTAFAAWLAEVTAALFAVLPINPSLIWSLIPSWQRHVRKLMRDLESIAQQGWEAAERELNTGIPFDVTNPVLQDQLRRTRNFMVNTPDEVYRMILKVLDQHAGDLGAQERAVRNVLDVTGTENWTARARTVAVTEVNRAFHFGSLALAMQAPGTVVKKWIAKEDRATRPTHAAADNQTRPVMQPFLVGVSALMAPGDPSGPPHEVINCRCKLSYLRRL